MSRVRRTNLWGGIAVFLIIFAVCVNTAPALSGSGTEADPWLIQSLADFNDFASDANYWDDYTRLETDVNLAGRVYERAVIAPDVNSSNMEFDGVAFTGVFDGNDHKIENMDVNDGGAGHYYVGCFGFIGEDGEIRNLGIEGGCVSGGVYVAGLVGQNGIWHGKPGIILNCYSTGDVNGLVGVGGLTGENWGSISDCYSTGDVNGADAVGGLVGDNYGVILNCYSTAKVSGYGWVGGLVGNNGDTVSNSYSIGDVSGISDVGGLVGNNGDTVSNCYSTGDVRGYDLVGGLVGWNGWSVSNCYSTSSIGGTSEVGGLVGYNDGDGDVSLCFWDTDTQAYGLTESVGENWGTAILVFGLPTSQMHQQSSFFNWDFIGVWNIGENQTYPYLRTVPAGDINKDKTVNFLDVCIIAAQWCNEE